MHGSAFDLIHDPNDPAWHGHAQVVDELPWWRSRSALGAGVGIATLLVVVAVWLVARPDSPGSSADVVAASAAAAGPASADGAAAAAPRPATSAALDRALPVIDPEATRAAADTVRTLPVMSGSSTANGAGGAKPVPGTLTGPSGDIGAADLLSESTFPSLYIDEGPPSELDSPFDSWGATANLTGDLQGLNPTLRIRLDELGKELGARLDVISGFRTHEEQEKLYEMHLNGTGNLAAVPGTSRHETGLAADVYVNGVALANVSGASAAAAQLGLGFPVGGEAWHTELVSVTKS